MAQNDNLYGSSNSGLGSSSGADSFGASGTGAGQDASTGAYGSGSGSLSGTAGNVGNLDLGASSSSQSAADKLHGARDAAADKLSQAKDMANERLGQVRERASQLTATLADKLEAGATSLRNKSGSGDAMGLADDASANANPQLQKLASTGATALEKSAQFLRDGDLKGSIETQVRTNPGRTLLIAVGVGYALGKLLRGNDRRY